MAQLKDLLVNGDTRVIGNFYGHFTTKNVNMLSVDLTSKTTTIATEVKALKGNSADESIHYARFYTTTNGGSSGITDKPTGSNDLSFVCEAILNRWASNTDYRYVLLCWVEAQKNPYVAIVENGTTAVSWTKLCPTVHTGTSEPAASTGQNGDIYIQTS